MIVCPACGRENPDSSTFCEGCGRRLDSAADPFVGMVIDDRYEVKRKIAEGGMGTVYSAKNIRLDIDAAIKILHTDLARNKKFLTRFENEAKTVVRLRHTNIVQVFDTGSVNDTYYLAMEFIEGEDLVDIIFRKGKLPFEEAFYIAVQVAQGLAYAHDRGILHRDIKPANIIIEPSGRTVITDFGISRTLKSKGDTTIGAVVGTPEYMSLEQLKGTDIDARADIYSLGVVLYEMLTGISPFRAEESVQSITRVLSQEAQPIEEISPDLPEWAVEVVNRAMAKNRDDRFGSAREFIAAVSQHMTDSNFAVPEIVPGRKAESAARPSWIAYITDIVGHLPPERRLLTGILFSLIVVGLLVTGVLLVKSIPFSFRSLFSFDRAAPLGPSRLADKVWAFKTFGPITATPLVSGGVLYVGNGDDTLYAVETTKGEQLWAFKTKEAVNTTPAISGRTIFFGSDDHSLYALSTKNGDLLWRFTTKDKVRSSPALSDKLVIFGSDDDTVYAVDKTTGEEIWRFETNGEVVSSPAVSGKIVYFGSDDNIFYAVDLSTGKEVWRFETDGDIDSSPVVTKKLVLFGSNDNYLYALDKATGQEVWRFETNGDIVSRPAVTNTDVYVGSKDDSLYAVELEKGTLVWSFKTEGDIIGEPAFTERSILIGSDDHNVYAVNINDGTERWRFPTEGKVVSGPVVLWGVAYLGSLDGYIYAIK